MCLQRSIKKRSFLKLRRKREAAGGLGLGKDGEGGKGKRWAGGRIEMSSWSPRGGDRRRKKVWSSKIKGKTTSGEEYVQK